MHRHGSRHDIYRNPVTKQKQPVPRHTEIDHPAIIRSGNGNFQIEKSLKPLNESTRMKIKIHLLVFIAAFSLFSCASATTKTFTSKPTLPPFPCHFERFEDFFPLSRGACLIYKGQQRSQINGPTDVEAIGAIVEQGKIDDITIYTATREIMPMMEVTDTADRGNVTGYSVRGSFEYIGSDIQTFVVLQPDKLFRTKQETLDKIRDEKSILYNLVGDKDNDLLFLDLPLTPGKKYGSQVQIFRLDNSYCWEVERVEWVSVDTIKGCPLQGLQPEFVLSYKTLPGNVEIRVIPGLGITAFKYIHHGPIDEVETKLIHYYPGVSKPYSKPSQQ